MVSENKVKLVKELRAEAEKYPVVGILDMHKLPAKQLHEIREKLRDQARIFMIKKRLLKLAFKDLKVAELEKYMEGQPALLFSESDPFKLARVIAASKSKTAAKAGDVAPSDIMIRAGPTSLPPGPVIGELQKAGVPASVEGDRIAVKKDTVLVKEGEEINSDVAGVLAKLGIEPMDISLNLLAVWEKGMIYTKEILFIPPEKYENDLKEAFLNAFNLTLNIGYVTPQNIGTLLSKAHNEVLSLAMAADIVTKETLPTLLAKAGAQAEALKGMMKEPEKPAEPVEEAKPEEKPAEEKPTEEVPKEEPKPEKPKEEAPKVKPKKKPAEKKPKPEKTEPKKKKPKEKKPKEKK